MTTDSEQLATIMSRQIDDRQRAALEQLQRDLATVQEIGRLREALSLCVDRLIGLSEDGLTKIEQVALSTAQAALAQPAAPSAEE